MAQEQSDFLATSGQGVVSVTVKPPAYPADSSIPIATTYKLKSLFVSNRNAAARYIWISNTGNAGDPPYKGMVFFVPQGGAVTLGSDLFGLGGIGMKSTTFTVAISTSSTAYAAATAADHDITVYYRE